MDTDRHQKFAEQYVLYQGRVYGYIVTMLPNRHDAEDVFQQTSLILWQKWDQFDPSRDFLGWACGIAHNEVRNFLRRGAHAKLVFSQKTLDSLADTRLSSESRLAYRRRLLAGCVKKLGFQARQLLERCYSGRQSMQAIARQFRITANALYLRLRRIRRELFECVERAAEDDRQTKEDMA